MKIALTWDLFILAFFVIIIAYNFIIGKNRSLKTIIGTYLAILTADGVGNLFAKYLGSSNVLEKVFNLFSIGGIDKAEIAVKVFIFVAMIVFFVIRGGFRVYAGDEFTGVTGLILLFVFGFLSATLMLSSLIVLVSGGSLINLNSVAIDLTTHDFYESSRFAKILIQHYNLWFVLPAIAFAGTSLLASHPREEEMEI